MVYNQAIIIYVMGIILMKYDDLQRYLVLALLADLFLEFLSFRSGSLLGELLFGTVFAGFTHYM